MTTPVNTPEAWSDRARSFGSSWEAAGWTESGQADRFMAVLRNLRAQPGETLLDFGCGTGAFAKWLPPSIEWRGWDWAEGMRERARVELAGRGNCAVLEASPIDDAMIERFDHVVAIGAFNLPDGWSRRRTWETLRELWRRTDRSMIVSLYRGWDALTLDYSPFELVDFIENRECVRWRIDATYRDNDMLLVMRR